MFSELLVLPGGFVMEARIVDPQNFSLSLRKGRALLIEYSHASGYEFKSVEKLRYDFERDAEDALRRS
jgi:hypothetical protein